VPAATALEVSTAQPL